MKYLKLFENYFSNPKSKDSKELYNELLPLFTPSYNLERPSGYSLELIEMRFNNNTKYEDVIDIIVDSNWYVVKSYKGDDGSIRRIDIRPKYSNFIAKNIPSKTYHISPSSNDESIKSNGLVSSNAKKMGINYPNRIYIVSDLKTLEVFSKELNWYVDESEWTVWEIDMTKLNIDFLYVDETVNQNLSKPTSFYLQEVDIPSDILQINSKTNF